MGPYVRDRDLLAALEPDDRAQLLEFIEDFIAEELPTGTEEELYAAAEMFEQRAQGLSTKKRLLGMQIAAALRLRANPGAVH